MSLKTILANIWAKKDEKESFIENELVDMGPGEIKKGKKNGK